MMNIDYYREYIQDSVINHLERLMGDTRLCCAGARLEFIGRKMAEVIADDDQFGRWASEEDLIVAAECWGDNMRQYDKETSYTTIP